MSDDLRAPYHNFAPRRFYDTVFIGGAYVAEIMGCNWTCEGCWSAFGWRGRKAQGLAIEPKFMLTPAEAAAKCVKGMLRNEQQVCRITGGEPLMHWEHTKAFVREVLDRTKDEKGLPMRLHAAGKSDPEGEVFGVMIETNGSMLTPDMLDELQASLGTITMPDDTVHHEAQRVVISLGIKATSPQLLAELNGTNEETAERQHKAQMTAMWHLYRRTKFMGFVSYLEPYADKAEVARIQREVERIRPGSGRGIDVLAFSKNYPDPTRLGFTPKRKREGSS